MRHTLVVALVTGSFLLTSVASAFTIDFVAAAASNEGAGIPSFVFNDVDGSGIDLTATARDLTDGAGTSESTDPYPYLDDLFNGNPGGMGVCQTTTCAGSSDDNIGYAAMGEVLVLSFSGPVTIQSVTFNNGVHLQNFTGSIGIHVGSDNPTDAASFNNIFAASGVINTSLTGSRFSFVAPASFSMIDTDDQQIYVDTITFVPEPGTALLMGLGLVGLAASRSRRAR